MDATCILGDLLHQWLLALQYPHSLVVVSTIGHPRFRRRVGEGSRGTVVLNPFMCIDFGRKALQRHPTTIKSLERLGATMSRKEIAGGHAFLPTLQLVPVSFDIFEFGKRELPFPAFAADLILEAFNVLDHLGILIVACLVEARAQLLLPLW